MNKNNTKLTVTALNLLASICDSITEGDRVPARGGKVRAYQTSEHVTEALRAFVRDWENDESAPRLQKAAGELAVSDLGKGLWIASTIDEIAATYFI